MEADEAQLQLQPLSTAYFSFNQWCDFFYRIGIHLQELTEENLRNSSTRSISYQQFTKRLERRLNNSQELIPFLTQFSENFSKGIPLDSPAVADARDCNQ